MVWPAGCSRPARTSCLASRPGNESGEEAPMTSSHYLRQTLARLTTVAILTLAAAASLTQQGLAQGQGQGAGQAQGQGGGLLGRVGRGVPEDALKSSDKDTRQYNKRDFN